MTSASTSIRWRRALAVCAASAGMHYALIGWDANTPPAPASRLPAKVVVQLRAAPVVERKAALAPRPPEAGAAFPLPQVQLSSPSRPAAKAGQELPRYRAAVPPSAQLVFDVVRSDTDGLQGRGQAAIDWRHDGAQYRLSVSSEVPGSSLLAVTSEGALGAHGIVPRMMTVQRRGRARTATHFDPDQGRITFSASAGNLEMVPGTQDRATFPLQLAGIARARGGQLGAQLQLMVGEEKEAGLVRVLVTGQEELETPMGRMITWHLSTAPDPASYRPRIEVWLAPEQQWYPVQLRSTEANGTVTTQTIRTIVINE